MANTTIAGYLYRMVKEDRFRRQRYTLLAECKDTKLVKLWNILFETDIRDAETMEERIYEFGSMVKEEDIWGREIFVCLVAFLNLVIKQEI